MPLSPEQEWTLAACGLVAHADGIVEAGEWDRVLWMLDDRIGDDDASTWVDLLSDRDRLKAHVEGLAPPMPFFCEAILEKAWRMALADGEGSPHETAVHDELAAKLGIDGAQASQLRAGWLSQAYRRSELVAGFASILAHLDGKLDPTEVAALEALVERLPTPPDRKEPLAALRADPPPLDRIVGELMAMDVEERGIALLALVPLVRAGTAGGPERSLFVDVATRLAISPDEIERLLER